MGSYMGTTYGTEMGCETGFHEVPIGGHKWEPYGSYSRFDPSGPCPANLCRINFGFNSAQFCAIEYLNSFHKAVEDVICAEMHK